MARNSAQYGCGFSPMGDYFVRDMSTEERREKCSGERDGYEGRGVQVLMRVNGGEEG